MARTVTVLRSYTGVRSRLSRLEIAVEKDERVSPEDRANVREHIRRLVSLLMAVDAKLPLSATQRDLGRGGS